MSQAWYVRIDQKTRGGLFGSEEEAATKVASILQISMKALAFDRGRVKSHDAVQFFRAVFSVYQQAAQQLRKPIAELRMADVVDLRRRLCERAGRQEKSRSFPTQVAGLVANKA